METSGAVPPVHLERDPLCGSASSGGGMPPPKRRGIGGTGAKPRARGEAAAGSTASVGEMPLANLPNLMMDSSRPRRDAPNIKELSTTTSRSAGEKKHTESSSNGTSHTRGSSSSLHRVRSNASSPRGSSLSMVTSTTSSPRGSFLPKVRTNAPSPRGSFQPRDMSNTSSPRDSSLRPDRSKTSSPRDSLLHISQALRSTSTSCHRFALLSIKDADSFTSHSPDARLGNTTAHSRCRENVTSYRPMQKAGMRFSGGDMPQGPCSSVRAGRGLTIGIPHKHWTVAGLKAEMALNYRSVGGLDGCTPQGPSATLKADGVLSIEKPQKRRTITERPHKHQAATGSKGEVAVITMNGVKPQKRRTKDQGSVTVRELQTDREKSRSESFPRESSLHTSQELKRITISQDAKESIANKNGHLTEDMIRKIQEADCAIQQLNELGLGEDISNVEFEGYCKQLPCRPPLIDTSVKPGYRQLDELQVRNVLYRIKYCKFIQQMRKNNGMLDANLDDDHPLYHLAKKLECLKEDITKLERDHLLEYLEREGLLTQIENDGIFGWSFDCSVAGLDDYQRITPQNYGGCEYECVDTYRRYFHSYEIELEYVSFWEELLKKLMWMEDYVLLKRPSLKWGKICSRGCYQAIKIATCFSKITEGLARAAYYDCIDTMCLDIHRYKDWDGIYFEIWQRITKFKESFKDALNEVYKSDNQKMKDTLKNENFSVMEKEFHVCTAGITEEVTEENAQELIAHAMKNQRGSPKVYAQYIRRKMDFARAIGVITK